MRIGNDPLYYRIVVRVMLGRANEQFLRMKPQLAPRSTDLWPRYLDRPRCNYLFDLALGMQMGLVRHDRHSEAFVELPQSGGQWILVTTDSALLTLGRNSSTGGIQNREFQITARQVASIRLSSKGLNTAFVFRLPELTLYDIPSEAETHMSPWHAPSSTGNSQRA